MKRNKIAYWVLTVLIAVFMLYSAYGYLTTEQMKAAFVHLGFPDYFRVELAIAKILGALVLVIPKIPAKLKEFAYWGFGITFISAFVAHTASGDPSSYTMMPIIFLVILIASYVFFLKENTAKA